MIIAKFSSDAVLSLVLGHVGSDAPAVKPHTETIQAGVTPAGTLNELVNTQVDQLIQAMATYSVSSGLSWDQAIDQRPEDVKAILAASWQ
jgi:hypothetical protein